MLHAMLFLTVNRHACTNRIQLVQNEAAHKNANAASLSPEYNYSKELSHLVPFWTAFVH